MNSSRSPLFKVFFIFIAICIVLGVVYNVWLYFHTKNIIEEYQCEPTGEVRQEVSGDRNGISTTSWGLYQCVDKKRWLRIYDF